MDTDPGQDLSSPLPEIPGIVGGSQIFYLVAGRAFESKDIDLFIEDYNPLEVSRIIAETLGLEEERFELFKRGDNIVTHIFIPLPGRHILSIEIMSRTHLGKISGSPLFDEVIVVERDGNRYWALSLEAYAVLTASRPEGWSVIDIERFKDMGENINWDRAESLSRSLSMQDRFRRFREAVEKES